jgi:Trk K+ transport system NAD-binding subunit
MVQRILAGGARVLGEVAGLHVAEAVVPPGLVATVAEVEEQTGVEVLGTWRRGEFETNGAAGDAGVLILAGTPEQLRTYDERFGATAELQRPVMVIGGGRVGRRVGKSLEESGTSYLIVERLVERVRDPVRYVVGDAADLDVLSAAGIGEAGAVVITTHDDDVNVYLTIYLRKLRPDIQVIARANVERNVSTLYRAGADAVLSYASTGASAVWNWFRPKDTLLVAEHLEVFRMPVPSALVGRGVAESEMCERSGCALIAVEDDGRIVTRPEPSHVLPANGTLVLLGDDDDQRRFEQAFVGGRYRR